MTYILVGALVYLVGFAFFTGIDYIKFDRIDPIDLETNLLWPASRPIIWFAELRDWLSRRRGRED